MKKLLVLMLTALCLICLCGCSSSGGQSSGDGGDQKQLHVGVVQLVQHAALDAATQGFEDQLKKELGDSVTVDVQNASGDSANCSVIVNGFI
ncbi:MAG: hypothetical protein IJI92_02065, partial [Erysipelotrichaceae bacterium]|nr:hypothetical protein [Erysipelotrichaceae bacterium]